MRPGNPPMSYFSLLRLGRLGTSCPESMPQAVRAFIGVFELFCFVATVLELMSEYADPQKSHRSSGA